jgi:hypothetical protein
MIDEPAIAQHFFVGPSVLPRKLANCEQTTGSFEWVAMTDKHKIKVM